MQKRTGIFLIHGFLGSPNEWHTLEHALRDAGYQTHALTQLGHGKSPNRKLSELDAGTLLNHCREEYERFAGQCDSVYVIGHSLGGVSALWLAGQRPDKLAGVMSFSAPYEHAYGVNYAHGLLVFKKRHLPYALRYAPECLTEHERPALLPWWLVKLQRQTAELLSLLRDGLPEIEVPVCLAHSPYDIAIPCAEMNKIEQHINQPHLVQTHSLDACGHQVFVSRRVYEQPYRLVFQFLSETDVRRPEKVLVAAT